MSAINYQHLALDWQPSNNNERDFYRISALVLCLTLVLGIMLSAIPVPEKERRAVAVVPDRIAKFISQKAKPPAPIAKPKPKIEPKSILPPKPEVKPKPTIERKKPSEVEQKPLSEVQQKARETAANSGLLALSNELNDLVDSGDVATKVAGKLVDNSTAANQTAGHNADIITGGTAKGGGTVDAARYGSTFSATELSAREITQAKSELLAENVPANKNESGNLKAQSAGRSYEENVTVIFDKNKGSLYALYDRERRKTPGLKGKIVLQITISGTGDVTNVKMVSSTLNNPSLEARIVSRIKQFKFGTNGAGPITVTYPIEFLPS